MRGSRRLPLEAIQPYLLDVPHPRHLRPDSPLLAPAPRLDFAQVFSNAQPVEIEIGCGKGIFLAASAAARLDTNFLGIEIERKYALYTASRLARRQLANAKIACTDARWFVRERLSENSVAALHVYFPDPWWKTRHKKRKLMTADFAEQCARILQPNGRLHFITDVADYFAITVAMVSAIAAFTSVATPVAAEAQTNFERKYRLEGRPIYRACYEKRVKHALEG